jgi:hypothetical protein
MTTWKSTMTPWTSIPSRNDSDDGEIDIVALHNDAVEKYAIKTKKIREEITLLPSLHSIYFNPDKAFVPTAPEDLQLLAFFALYNEIARAGFTAQKNLPVNINRIIWYYGTDKGRSFSRFYDQTR